MKPIVILALIALAGASPARSAAPATARGEGRGLWFWSKPASPYGATNVVGDGEHEADALATFARWNIRRVYGSYLALPVERATAVANWNRRLADAGIRSESLFSDNAAITPNGRAGLLRLVEARVLAFNRSRMDARERFAGIALDVEPHATAPWKTATLPQKRAMLEEFVITCGALRTYLDEHGARDIPISAALAYWLDRLPPNGPGWQSAADRDDWFARLGRSVACISLMAYERPAPAAILDATVWEREHFPGRVRTALRARLGMEWKSLADLTAVLPAVERVTGGVDLENYELLRVAEKAAERAPTAR